MHHYLILFFMGTQEIVLFNSVTVGWVHLAISVQWVVRSNMYHFAGEVFQLPLSCIFFFKALFILES